MCHQLLQNFLALCLTAKARSAVDFIHFGFVPYPFFFFELFLNLKEECEISRLIF